MPAWELVIVVAATFLAGGVNSVAGGGTLIAFPALVWLGHDPVLAINGVAVAWFAARGAVLWDDALAMMVGAGLGGFAGARLAHRVGRTVVRRAVVAIGLSMTLALLLHLR